MSYAKFAAVAALLSSLATHAHAADLTASNCEIYIKRVGTAPSSHGSASLPVVVKVNWIGNDEHIERVGFYSKSAVRGIGDTSACGYRPEVQEDWHVQDASYSDHDNLAYGEYLFRFPILTGTVLSNCRGYEFSNSGSFFVQTDKNTYWLNPDHDASKLFVFDRNGYQILAQQLGIAASSATDRDFLRYYNPSVCR